MMHWKPRGIKADVTIGGLLPSIDNIVDSTINEVKNSVSKLSNKIQTTKNRLKMYNSRIRRFRDSGEGDIELLTDKLKAMGFTMTKSGYISVKGFEETYNKVGVNNLDNYVPAETEKWKTDVAPRLNAEKQAKAKVSLETEIKAKLSEAFDELLGEYYEDQHADDRIVDWQSFGIDPENPATEAIKEDLDAYMSDIGKKYRNNELSVEDIYDLIAELKGKKI